MEAKLLGFKVELPLTPEDQARVEAIADGLQAVLVRTSGMSGLFMPRELRPALEALCSAAVSLLDASRAASAAPRSGKRPS